MSAVERHAPIVKSLVFHAEEDTQRFAAALAVQPALRHAFVELHGQLGAGKTTLVRHLLRALGVSGRIKSPTYAVVEPYEVQVPVQAEPVEAGASPTTSSGQTVLNVWHFDFYRFHDPREWEDAGFRDLFASPGLKLAEWPEKADAVLPLADLVIALDVQADESRRLTLTAQTTTGAALLQGMT